MKHLSPPDTPTQYPANDSAETRRNMAIEAARLACEHARSGNPDLARQSREIMARLSADRRLVL